ncbi:MAG TPA: DNA gyrase inhibitor YacG [Candidatus Hypogeohydataceae bacterium YC41]
MPRIDCRYCGKELEYKYIKDLPYFPFCSERCKLIDLGLWVEGKHRIEEPLTPEKQGELEKEDTE